MEFSRGVQIFGAKAEKTSILKILSLCLGGHMGVSNFITKTLYNQLQCRRRGSGARDEKETGREREMR